MQQRASGGRSTPLLFGEARRRCVTRPYAVEEELRAILISPPAPTPPTRPVPRPKRPRRPCKEMRAVDGAVLEQLRRHYARPPEELHRSAGLSAARRLWQRLLSGGHG